MMMDKARKIAGQKLAEQRRTSMLIFNTQNDSAQGDDIANSVRYAIGTAAWKKQIEAIRRARAYDRMGKN